MDNVTSAPPLDLDLNSVDTSMPLLEDGLYDLQFAKFEQKLTGKQQKMLSVDIVTTGPAKSRDGQPLGPGIHIFDTCMLEPAGKSTWDMVAKNAASITQAVGTSMTLGDFINGGFMQLQGQQFRARVGFEPAGRTAAGKEYKAKNVISIYIPANKR